MLVTTRATFVVLVIGFLACGPIVRAEKFESDTAIDTSQTDITLMTYNIRVGLGINGTREGDEPISRLEGMVDLIEESSADIVLLQEVDKDRERTERVDQAAFLAEALGFEHSYAPAIRSDDGQLYGIAVLSRWPIQEERIEELYQPDYSDHEPELPGYYNEQRVVQSVRIETPHGPVTAVNTHLGLTYEQRVKQLEEISEVIDDGLEEGPVLFGGDLNSQPDVPSLLPVRERLRDAYLFFTNENGLTSHMDVTERLTFRSDDPSRCIDYLFVSDETFDVLDTEVLSTTLSDHLPVVSWLRVSGSGGDS